MELFTDTAMNCLNTSSIFPLPSPFVIPILSYTFVSALQLGYNDKHITHKDRRVAKILDMMLTFSCDS